MRSQEAITQEIREGSDIVEVVGQVVSLKPAGRNLRGLCPFHQEKTPSFNVNATDQYFKCFGCGAGGDVFKFMQMYHSISFPEARQMLADRAGIRIEATRGPRDGTGTPRAKLMEINRWALARFQENLAGPAGQVAREYLISRGISDASVASFKLGFAPEAFRFLAKAAAKAGISEELLLAAGLLKPSKQPQGDMGAYDAFRNRLIFPILDPVGQVLGFGGRTLGDDSAKYINSIETPVFSKRKVLYGLHLTREAFKKGRAVLVEGYTDVIMAHQLGFGETVAALGTSLTDEHAKILLRYVPKVVLVFDGDEAGIRAAERGVDIALRSQLDVHLGVLPQGQDPCDFLIEQGVEAFEAKLNSAPSALEFRWSRILERFQRGDSSSARNQAVREFVAYVATSEAYGKLDTIQRGVVVHQLSRLLGVANTETERLLREAKEQATEAIHRDTDRGAREHQDLRDLNDIGEYELSDRASHGGYADNRGNRGHISSQPAAASSGGRSLDAEQAAYIDILTVTICEPGMYPQLAEWLRPERFTDPQLQRIVVDVLDLIERLGSFSAAELLDRLDSQDAARAVELIDAGRALGHLAERLEAACSRLESISTVRRSKEAGQALLASGGPQSDSQAPAEQGDLRNLKLAEIYESVRQYADASNFAGMRKLRVRPDHSTTVPDSQRATPDR